MRARTFSTEQKCRRAFQPDPDVARSALNLCVLLLAIAARARATFFGIIVLNLSNAFPCVRARRPIGSALNLHRFSRAFNAARRGLRAIVHCGILILIGRKMITLCGSLGMCEVKVVQIERYIALDFFRNL